MRHLRALPLCAAALLAAWALKSFGSRAGAGELNWLLSPACRLAGTLSGASLEWEEGAGWVSHQHRMIVGPSCSGLNFMIIAFLTIAFTLAGRLARPAAWRLPAWIAACLGASLAAAWGLTVVTNGARISLLLHAGADSERLHRAGGALVYCASLLLAHLALQRILDRLLNSDAAGRSSSALVPLGCYLAVTIGVPLANRSWRTDSSRFLEHAATTVTVCTLIALAVFAARRLGKPSGASSTHPCGDA